VTTVLLIDDDAFVLEALGDVIASRRPAWKVVRAPSMEEGLSLLVEFQAEAAVVDIGLGGGDGVATLEIMRRDFPHVLRVVLSGNIEAGVRARAAVAAHRYLSKPCDAARLIAVIEQGLAVRALLEGHAVRAAIGKIGPLPAAPRSYIELTNALENPATSLPALAAIVQQDVATCAKVLQFANSGFFAMARPITDVQSALAYLGIDLLRALVLSAGALSAFRPRTGQRFSAAALSEHGMSVAQAAKSLADGRLPANEVFVAAMLHDVGKLVLSVHLPLQFDAAVTRAMSTGQPVHVVERELYGFTHSEVGAYLLGLWGLPSSIVEGVAFHHDPGRLPHDTIHLADLIHAADFVVHHTLLHDDGPTSFAALDLSHLRPSQKPVLLTASNTRT
jgi:HD-like signal output (HDOD) protein/ActR/RegA family two-component response regulator